MLDPFAGGSVRGCVAGRLGLAYHGVDLSAAQVAENRAQAAAIAAAATRGKSWRLPSWTAADARELATLDALPPRFDFVFSCPPYYDLEQYSDDPRDLSKAPTYAAFLDAYRAIVADAVARLERGRFACFVVGEVRDADGFMHSLVADTIAAFAAAGGRLYNHAVMMLPLHSLPMRAPAALGVGEARDVPPGVWSSTAAARAKGRLLHQGLQSDAAAGVGVSRRRALN